MIAMRRLLLAVLLVLAGAAAVTEAAPDAMSIQVRNAQLRATPSYLGKVTGSAPYAARVRVLQEQGEWIQVQSGAATGWLHQSALSAKAIVMKAGASDVGATASGEELALAGKGFNADVEADFKQKHAKIDFAPIDRMEKIQVTAEQARAFLAEGGLTPARGGAR